MGRLAESIVQIGGRRLALFILVALPCSSFAQIRVQSYAFSQGVGFTSGQSVRIGVSVGQSLAGFGHSPESAGGAGFWYATRERLVIVGSESETLPEGIPADFELHPNYPNPFNPSTKIRYGVPKTAFVRLGVYNVLGQLVSHLVSAEKEAGYHEVEWDGRHLGGGFAPSGVYFYRIEAGRFVETRSMVLQK